MLERDVDRRVCDHAKKHKLLCIKLTMLGRYGIAGLPDRLFIGKGPVIFFIEMKKPGGRTTPLQDARIKQLRGFGFAVAVVDNVTDGRAFIDSMMRGRRGLRRAA